MARKTRPHQGCCNCKYSCENKDGIFCGRKAGTLTRVTKDDWINIRCRRWEYDGVSEGFAPKEEYDKMPYEC